MIAYIISSNQEPEIKELRAFLAQTLPEYMIPSAFVFLNAFPLTKNGKTDLKQLEQREVSFEADQDYMAPRNTIEQELATIWAEVLRVEKASVHDDFFDLGGHSLLATQIQSRIRDTFEVDIPIRDLFEFSTIEKMSGQIEALRFPNAIGQEREQGAL